MTSVLIIAIGVALMILIAAEVGRRSAAEAAWRRIAAKRRELAEWERDLIAATERRGCAACRLRNAEGDL